MAKRVMHPNVVLVSIICLFGLADRWYGKATARYYVPLCVPLFRFQCFSAASGYGLYPRHFY